MIPENSYQTDAVQVTIEQVKIKRLTIDLSDWRVDPVEYDTIEVILDIPNGRPRTIKFSSADFIPRNF